MQVIFVQSTIHNLLTTYFRKVWGHEQTFQAKLLLDAKDSSHCIDAADERDELSISVFQLSATFGSFCPRVTEYWFKFDPTLHTRIPRALHLSFSGVFVRRLEQGGVECHPRSQSEIQIIKALFNDVDTAQEIRQRTMELVQTSSTSVRRKFTCWLQRVTSIWGIPANNFIWLISALFGTEVCLFILRYISFVGRRGLLLGMLF